MSRRLAAFIGFCADLATAAWIAGMAIGLLIVVLKIAGRWPI